MFPPISFLASLFLLGLIDQFFRNLKRFGKRKANRLVYVHVKRMKVPIEEQKVVYINSFASFCTENVTFVQAVRDWIKSHRPPKKIRKTAKKIRKKVVLKGKEHRNTLAQVS